MSFLNPVFLFALVAVALPLLIHLLNIRKPQKVAFSTLAFFRELRKTTIRRIRIKRLLLLLLRLAAIACLAMVLARPFLPPGLLAGGNTQAPALNAVLLDNSISMSRIGTKGPLLEYGNEIIQEIERASREDDRFILQTTNGEERYPGILSHSNLLNAAVETEVSDAGNYTGERLRSMVERLKDSPYANKKLFILSDGQQSQFEDLGELDELNIAFTFIDAGEVSVQNTAVAGVQTSTNMIGVNIPFVINVELKNYGEVPAVNQFVSLEFEGEPAGQYPVSLPPGEKATYSFEVSPSSTGSVTGRVLVEGDEFQPDNTWYYSIQVPETREVLWVRPDQQGSEFISYTGAMLQVAGENDAQLIYEEVEPSELGAVNLSEYDALILDGLREIPAFIFQPVQDFIQGGKGVLFFPSEQGNLSNYNDFLGRLNAGRFAGLNGDYASFKPVARADELLGDHPAFSGLFDRDEDEELVFTRPDIYFYLRFQPPAAGAGFNLLSLNTGDVLVYEKKFGEGSLILSSIGTDPGWSNFPVKALFAPFYYRSLLYAASSDEGGFANHTLGRPFNWVGNINSEEAAIEAGGNTIKPDINVVANGIELSYPAREWVPGWVRVKDERSEYVISVNRSPEESDFNEINAEQLETVFDENSLAMVDASDIGGEALEREIQSSGFGREIWHWFMLAGLLLLVTESLVSVWYKAEAVN